MFRSLGFDPEALLKDHVRDAGGQLRDLMILAHRSATRTGAMAAVGIAGRSFTPMVDPAAQSDIW